MAADQVQLKTGLEGPQNEEDGDKRPRTRFLPDNIYDAIRLFKGSRFMQEMLGEDVHAKYAEIKLAQAERCPKAPRHPHQGLRGAVPPRGYQPVPLVAVLSGAVPGA